MMEGKADHLAVTEADFNAFLRERGLAQEIACPRCGMPAQFGWSDDQTRLGNSTWSIPAQDTPVEGSFQQSCEGCGYTEFYTARAVRRWMIGKWQK